MKAFDQVWATVRYRRDAKYLAYLRPECEVYDGQVYQFTAAWLVEDGPHAGEWAMYCPDGKGPPYWIASGELEIAEPVTPFEEWIGTLQKPGSIDDFLNYTRLVEEVPGVPLLEQYYIWHGGKTVWHGPSITAGRIWARNNSIEIQCFEPFEP